jgi:hypothetical protein
MLQHDAWIVGRMLDLARNLTDAQLDQPLQIGFETIEEPGVTLRQLLARLVDTKERWAAAVEGRTVPLQDDRSLDGLRRRFGVAGPQFLHIVRDARRRGDEDVTFIDATCDPPETFTYGGVIEHVLTFSAFRRTLALSAFDMFGLTELGSGDPRNWEPVLNT